MAHVLELFSGGCPLCVRFQAEVELGKCGPCQLDIVDVNQAAAKPRMQRYGVRVVPTMVIDGKIKVEGRLEEPWICGDDFYAMLERKYPIVNAKLRRPGPS